VQYNSNKYSVHLTGLVSDICFYSSQPNNWLKWWLVFGRWPVCISVTTMTILTQVFCGFLPQTLQANVRIISQGYDCFPTPHTHIFPCSLFINHPLIKRNY
jgi:hypothetical protein